MNIAAKMEWQKEMENKLHTALEEICECLGINSPTVTTCFSNGISFYIFENECRTGKKIRISDHPVTNISRVFNESHYSIDALFNCEQSLKDELEKTFAPERFTVEVSKETRTVKNSTVKSMTANELLAHIAQYPNNKVEQISEVRISKRGREIADYKISYEYTEVVTVEKTVKL